MFGQNLRAIGTSERTRFRGHTVGFVFQAFNLIPTLTIAENAAVPLLINGVARAEAVSRAGEILTRVGLGTRLKDLPNRLSGGQRRQGGDRASVDPQAAVDRLRRTDECMDKDTGHSVMELLREVAIGPEQSLIVVTHDSRIFEFADRIARMNDGQIEKVVESHAEL